MALLAEYGFREGVGLHAYDSSGNGRSLTATNATTSWDSEGGRTEITGQVGPNSSLTSFTMMAWVKRTGTWTGFAAMFGKSGWYAEANSAASYEIDFWGGSNNQGIGAGALLALNTWTHVAVTRDGTNTRLYVGGVLKGSAVANPAQNFGTGTWGVALTATTAADDATFVGTVKDFRTFDTTLDAAAITTQMSTTSSSPGVTQVATTTGAPAAATAFAITLPSHAATDRMILAVVGKGQTTTIPTINQSWVLVNSGTGGTGTVGADTGQMFWAIYAKDALSGSETAPTVTPGGTAPDSWEWICSTFRKPATEFWADSIQTLQPWVASGSDTNTASPLTATLGSFAAQPTSGDAIFVVGAIPTDLGTALGATTITATGLSLGKIQAATTQYVENALGNDTAAVWASWLGFAGTPSTALTASFTVTGATNQSGSIIAVALRHVASFPWTNTATVAAPRNGTTTHTVHPDGTGGTVIDGAAFTPTSGRLLVCLVDGSVTSYGVTGSSDPPAGWTLPTGGSAVNNTGLYVFYRTASGTSADQAALTHNASNYPIVCDFYEFAAGSTFVGSVASTGVANTGGAGPTLSGLTGTNFTAGAAAQGVASAATGGSTLWATGTEEVDTYVLQASGTDGYVYSLAFTRDNTASSVSYQANITPTATTLERLVFAIGPPGAPAQPASENVTISITASGSVSSTGVSSTADRPSTATITASAAAVETADRPTTATITATGLSIETADRPTTITLSAAGASIETADRPISVTLTAGGAAAATGNRASSITLTASGVVIASTSASVAVTANLTASSGVPAFEGSADRPTAVTISAQSATTGQSTRSTSSTITATGALSGQSDRASSATITGQGASAGQASRATNASITGSGALAGQASRAETITLTASGASSASGDQSTAVAISAAGLVTALGSASQASTISITVSGNLPSAPSGTASAATAASITASGLVSSQTTASRSTAATLTAAGLVTLRSNSDRASSVALTASGLLTLRTGADRDSTISITASGSLPSAPSGTANQDTTASTTATGLVTTRSSAAQSTSIVIDASGQIPSAPSAIAAVPTSAVITASGMVTARVGATQSTGVAITVTGQIPPYVGTADRAGTVNRTAAGAAAGPASQPIAVGCTAVGRVTLSGTAPLMIAADVSVYGGGGEYREIDVQLGADAYAVAVAADHFGVQLGTDLSDQGEFWSGLLLTLSRPVIRKHAVTVGSGRFAVELER